MAARRTGGLGKGLDALIPVKKPAEKVQSEQNQIKSNTTDDKKTVSPEKPEENPPPH